jgi:glycosyltransferase involved in cell wall biosynthesis
MWSELLARLPDLGVTIDFIDPGSSSRRVLGGRRPRSPDVWLSDGHQGPLEVAQPTVVQLHEATWDDPVLRGLMNPTFVATQEKASARAAEQATRIVTPSQSSRRQIIDAYGVPPSKVKAVHHGVNADLFRPGRPGGRELIGQAGGDSDRPYVVYVSVIHPRKNLGVLRAAVSGLAQRGYPHGLVLVAQPPADRPDAADLVREATAELPGVPGRVVWLHGLTEEQLASIVCAADVFCLPSLMEGFGLTALEAMACGIPVVVSNRGALPEVVDDAGVVIEPVAEAVENALASLVADPEMATRLSAAGRQRSLTMGWDRTAAAWLTVLEEAAAER